MIESIIIKNANYSDREEWASARLKLWPMHSKEEHLKELSEFLNADGHINFIGRDNGKVCCFLEASIRPYANGCTSRPVVFLEGIWVDPDYQRHGIGEKLVKKLEDWARDQGFREIGSDCEIDNTQSQNAHKKWGFQEREKVVYFCRDL